MTIHPHDEIEALALGDLDEEATRRLMDHADACPTCAILGAQAFAGVAALSAGQAHPVSDVLAKRITAIGGRPMRTRNVGSLAWIGSLAAALAAMLIWNIQLRANQPLVPVDALVHSHFLHHALKGPAGNAKVLIASDGSWVYLVADGLPARSQYDLWQRRGPLMTHLGQVRADWSGRVTQFWRQAPGAENGFILARAGADPMRDAAALRWP